MLLFWKLTSSLVISMDLLASTFTTFTTATASCYQRNSVSGGQLVFKLMSSAWNKIPKFEWMETVLLHKSSLFSTKLSRTRFTGSLFQSLETDHLLKSFKSLVKRRNVPVVYKRVTTEKREEKMISIPPVSLFLSCSPSPPVCYLMLQLWQVCNLWSRLSS